ncbi:hypothetical protein SS50377_23712 [Spironucleus salmonicida]|uniref:Uncharacterized protein n=1 Tax=Spironucleus salmonicida TaxID=348837 RepID=V6M5S9_9EUKA|nr:hypothetical protein SS50377_23712 [Spironucleus salmonicida]|eukprot:EST48694.1 Hypothetical protein SS50377_11307 [Spironucleus salmonicida]
MHNPKNYRPSSSLGQRLENIPSQPLFQKIFIKLDKLITAYTQNNIIVLQFKNYIEIYDMPTQTKLYKLDFQYLICASQILNQHIFVATIDGVLYQMDITQFSQGQVKTEALDILYTAKSGHTIYIPLQQSKIFCPNKSTNKEIKTKFILPVDDVLYIVYQQNQYYYVVSVIDGLSQFVRLPQISQILGCTEYLLIGHQSGDMSAYCPKSNLLVNIYDQYKSPIKQIAFYEQNTIFVGFLDGCVAFYNVETRTTEKTFVASEYQGETGDSIFDQTQIMFSQKGCQDMVFLDKNRILVLFKSFFFIFDVSIWQAIDIINYSFYGNKNIHKIILSDNLLLGVGPNIFQSIDFPEDMEGNFTKVDIQLDKIYLKFPPQRVISPVPNNLRQSQLKQVNFSLNNSDLIRTAFQVPEQQFLFNDYGDDELSDISITDNTIILDHLALENSLQNQLISQPPLQIDDLLSKASFIPEVSFSDMKKMAKTTQSVNAYDDLQGFLKKQQGFTQFLLSKTVQNGPETSEMLFGKTRIQLQQKPPKPKNTIFLEDVKQPLVFDDKPVQFNDLQKQQTLGQKQLFLEQSKVNTENQLQKIRISAKLKNDFKPILGHQHTKIPKRIQQAYSLKPDSLPFGDNVSMNIKSFAIPKSISDSKNFKKSNRFLYENTSISQLISNAQASSQLTKIDVSEFAAKILDLRELNLDEPLAIQRFIIQLMKLSKSGTAAGFLLFQGNKMSPEEIQAYLAQITKKLDGGSAKKDFKKLLKSFDFNTIRHGPETSARLMQSLDSDQKNSLYHVSEDKNIYNFLSETQRKTLESGYGNSSLRLVLDHLQKQGISIDVGAVGEEKAAELFQAFVAKALKSVQNGGEGVQPIEKLLGELNSVLPLIGADLGVLGGCESERQRENTLFGNPTKQRHGKVVGKSGRTFKKSKKREEIQPKIHDSGGDLGADSGSYSQESYTASEDLEVLTTEKIIRQLSVPFNQEFQDLTFSDIQAIFQILKFDVSSQALFAENLRHVYNSVLNQQKSPKNAKQSDEQQIALTKQINISVNSELISINNLVGLQLLLLVNDKQNFYVFAKKQIKNQGNIENAVIDKLFKFIMSIRKYFIQKIVADNVKNVKQLTPQIELEEKQGISGFKGKKSPIMLKQDGKLEFMQSDPSKHQVSALDKLAQQERVKRKKKTPIPKLDEQFEQILQSSGTSQHIIDEVSSEYYSTDDEEVQSESTSIPESDSFEYQFQLTEREKLFLKYIPFRDPFVETQEIKRSKMNIKYPECKQLLKSKSLINLQTRTTYSYVIIQQLCESEAPKIQLNKDIKLAPTQIFNLQPIQKIPKAMIKFENFVDDLLQDKIQSCNYINKRNLYSILKDQNVNDFSYKQQKFEKNVYYFDNVSQTLKGIFRSHSARRRVIKNINVQQQQKLTNNQIKLQKLNEKIKLSIKEIQKVNIFLALKPIPNKLIDDNCVTTRKTSMFKTYALKNQFELNIDTALIFNNILQTSLFFSQNQFKQQLDLVSDDEMVQMKHYKYCKPTDQINKKYLVTNLNFIDSAEYRNLNGLEDYSVYKESFAKEILKRESILDVFDINLSSLHYDKGIQIVKIDLQLNVVDQCFINNAYDFYINDQLTFLSSISQFSLQSALLQMLDTDYKEFYKNIKQPVVISSPDLSWQALKDKFLTYQRDIDKQKQKKTTKQRKYILKQEKLAQKQHLLNKDQGIKMTFSKMYQEKKQVKALASGKKNEFQIPYRYLQISLLCYSAKIITSTFQNTFYCSILALAETIQDFKARYLQILDNQQSSIIMPISTIGSLQFTKIQSQLNNFKLMLIKNVKESLIEQKFQNLLLESQALRDTQQEILEDYLSLSLYDKIVEHIKIDKITQWMVWSELNETKADRDKLALIEQQRLEKLKEEQQQADVLQSQEHNRIQAEKHLFEQFEQFVKIINNKEQKYKQIAISMLYIFNDAQDQQYSKQYFVNNIDKIIQKYPQFYKNLLDIELSIEVLRKQLQIDSSLHFYTLSFAKLYLEKSLEFKEHGFSFRFLGPLSLSGDSNIGLADFAQGVLNSKEFIQKQLIQTLSVIRNVSKTDVSKAAYFNVQLQMQGSPIRQELKKKKERFIKTQQQKSFIVNDNAVQMGIIGPSEKLLRSIVKNDMQGLKNMVDSRLHKLAESNIAGLCEDSQSDQDFNLKSQVSVNFKDYPVEHDDDFVKLSVRPTFQAVNLMALDTSIASQPLQNNPQQKPVYETQVKPQSSYERAAISLIKKSQVTRPSSKLENSKKAVLRSVTITRPVSQAEIAYRKARLNNDVDLNITGKFIIK